jgi:predicted PurR-regulated permease PerM
MRTRKDITGSFFLLALTAATLWVVYLVLKPLLSTLLLAAFLAILGRPVYERSLRIFRGKDNLAALAACALVGLLVVLPVAILLGLVTVESIVLYNQMANFVQGGGVRNLIDAETVATVQGFVDKYLAVMGGSELDVKAKIAERLQSLAGVFIAAGQKLAGNLAAATGLFFIMMFALFYFFADGYRVVSYLVEVSPLPEVRTRKLLRKFEDVTHAAFLGTFGVAAAQGILGGISLALVGYQGFFWGLVMTLCSLIPVAIIWVPAGVILFFSGRTGAGLFVLGWGILVISTVDNFLRPWLMGGRSGLHPLVILISVMGGIQQFGMLGIVFGPLVASMGLTLIDMFGEEFGSGRNCRNTAAE